MGRIKPPLCERKDGTFTLNARQEGKARRCAQSNEENWQCLAAQGVRYARVERLGRTQTLIAMALNVMLGLVIVAIEVVLAH